MIGADYGYSRQVNSGPGSRTNSSALQVMEARDHVCNRQESWFKFINAVTFIPKLLENCFFLFGVSNEVGGVLTVHVKGRKAVHSVRTGLHHCSMGGEPARVLNQILSFSVVSHL